MANARKELPGGGLPLTRRRPRGLRGPLRPAALRQPHCGAMERSRPQQAADVASFPIERALEVAKLPLALLELRWMQVHPAQAPTTRDHVVQHFVVNDVADEVPGHPLLVEPGVDTNEAVDAAVAPELDRLALAL